MKTKVYKVKEGKYEKLLAWAHELNTTYKDEVLETLREEHVDQEFAGTFTVEGKLYAIGFVLGTPLPSSDRELNKKHRDVLKDCLENPTFVTTLYDFKS